MNCLEAKPLRDAYVDGELDLIRSVDLERHLSGCPACSRALEDVQVLTTALKAQELYFKAPAQLARQIRAPLRLEQKRETRTAVAWWGWLEGGLATAAVALVLAGIVALWRGPSANERIAQEVTASHIRSLMAEHKTDVTSSDQHTVKPWFDGKLDFAPPVQDFAADGFPLVGGRPDYLHDRAVAALVYQRHKHFINVFIWPTPNAASTQPRAAVRQGYNLIRWTQAGTAYWAVSDLNPAELGTLVALLRAK